MEETQAFAQAVHAYLEALDDNELRTLVLRSLHRMDGAHRAQLGLFLGHEISADPIDEVGGGVDSGQLRAFVNGCGLLRERFAAFLIENPRAIQALGKSAAERIAGANFTQGQPRRRLAAGPFLIAAAAALIALVPLAAEYFHQTGMVSGLNDIYVAQMTPVQPPPAVHRARTRPAPIRRVAAAPVHRPAPVPVRPQAAPKRAARPAVRRAAPVRHAAPAPHAVRKRPVHAVARADGDVARARFVVKEYLNALRRGDTAIAMMPLGLPSNASPDVLRERAILSPQAMVSVTSARREPDGRYRVVAMISGARGNYREVFYILPHGLALRIVDRYYVSMD